MKTFALVTLSLGGLLVGCGDTGDPADPSSDDDVVVGGEEDLGPAVPEALRFHAAPGGFSAASPGHQARFDASGTLWVGSEMSDQPMGVSTDEIIAGGAPLANTIRSSSVNTRGEVEAARDGFVEKFSNGVFGVEQSWTILVKPSAPGDIVFRVAVAGRDFTGSSSQGLHFTSVGGFGTTYSNAVWIDAAGVETGILSTFEDGRIVIRVPADLVASSAFPAVLDPTIDSSETAVDAVINNVPTGAQAINPAVASSGTDYLAVWRDDRDGTDSDIYGMIITNAGGFATQNSVLISVAGGGGRAPGVQSAPTVAFVNGSYLVVWQDNKLPAADADLVAARVSTTGTVTLLGSIASTAAQELAPRIAVRGNEALVVYQSGTGVEARRYDGTSFVGAAIAVAATGSQPSAAANPAGDYLVAYTDAAATNLFGQLVTNAGALSGATLTLSDGLGAQELSSVQFAGGNFVVVWQNNRNGRKLFVARFNTAGVTTDTHVEGALTVGGVQLGTSATVVQGSVPELVCGATNCTVAWMDRRNFNTGGHDVFAQQFNFATLNPGAEISVTTDTADQKQPALALASSNERAFVVWEDLRIGSPSQIAGARLDGATLLDGAGSRLLASAGVNSEFNSAVGRIPGANQQWLIAWSDSRSTTTGMDIQAARADDSLAVTAVTTVSSGAQQQGTPAIGVTDNQHLVVWTDARNGAADIFGSRVGSDGTVQDAAGIAISTFTNDQARPQVASNGTDTYLVVWQDRGHANDFDIYGAIVSATTGTVTVAEIPISIAPGDQSAPSVAFDTIANQFVVVWQDGRAGASQRDIFGARVSLAGTTLDPSGVLISNAAGSQFTPKIVFGTDRFLAVWEDRRTGSGPGTNIFGARVQISAGGASLTIQDPTGIPISIAAGNQQRPAVGFVTTNEFTPPTSVGAFVVAWDDDRNIATNQLDVFGTAVIQSDATVRPEFAVATSTDSEAVPQIGSAGPAQVDGTLRTLVTYQRQDAALHVQRVVMRRITFGVGSVGPQHTSDALHLPAPSAKFFWLPTMSDPFTPTGTFDPTLRLRLKIRIDNLSACNDNAIVTTTQVTINAVTLSLPIETYRQTIKPATLGLTTGNCYRVVPTLDDIPLGFRDTHVTTGTAATGFKKWGPTANQTIPFRIEQ